jgi:hypothetical protein
MPWTCSVHVSFSIQHMLVYNGLLSDFFFLYTGAIEGQHMANSVSSIHNYLGSPAGAPAITSSAGTLKRLPARGSSPESYTVEEVEDEPVAAAPPVRRLNF